METTYQDACGSIVGNGIKLKQQKCPLLEGDQDLSEIYTIQWDTLAILKRVRQACRIQWTNTSGKKLHICFLYNPTSGGEQLLLTRVVRDPVSSFPISPS